MPIQQIRRVGGHCHLTCCKLACRGIKGRRRQRLRRRLAHEPSQRRWWPDRIETPFAGSNHKATQRTMLLKKKKLVDRVAERAGRLWAGKFCLNLERCTLPGVKSSPWRVLRLWFSHLAGSYKMSNGSRYDGSWLDDKMHGKGLGSYFSVFSLPVSPPSITF